MTTNYPIYIISKGRWEKRKTSKALEHMNVDYRIVVEPQEYEKYAEVIEPSKILKLPFSNLGLGSIPARNWVYEHSILEGHKRHWILDDNIAFFGIFNHNKKISINNAYNFRIIENFVDRYKNIAMSGMQYDYFLAPTAYYRAVSFNTRIYSCILLDNTLPHRWRGRFNEDTDLSLRILKDGYCTALFNMFFCAKTSTLIDNGGNTDELYAATNKRFEFAKSLQLQHPDVVRIVWRYNRWHHEVDYRPFKYNLLERKEDYNFSNKPNNYGLKLVKK